MFNEWLFVFILFCVFVFIIVLFNGSFSCFCVFFFYATKIQKKFEPCKLFFKTFSPFFLCGASNGREQGQGVAIEAIDAIEAIETMETIATIASKSPFCASAHGQNPPARLLFALRREKKAE